MSNKFKISTLVASILVSGLLVGCGSSSDDNSGVVPTPTPDAGKVTRTANNIYTVAVQENGNFFGVKKAEKVAADRDMSSVLKMASSILGTKVEESGLIKNVGVNGSSYSFMKDQFTTEDKLVVTDYYLDINKNSKFDAGDFSMPSQFLVAAGSYESANPFTTIEALTEDGLMVLGVKKADVDTSTLDEAGYKQLAYANALLNKAAKEYKADDSKVIKDCLKKSVAAVKAAVEGGAKLGKAVADVTGEADLETIEGTQEAVGDKLKTYGMENVQEDPTPNPGGGTILPQ